MGPDCIIIEIVKERDKRLLDIEIQFSCTLFCQHLCTSLVFTLSRSDTLSVLTKEWLKGMVWNLGKRFLSFFVFLFKLLNMEFLSCISCQCRFRVGGLPLQCQTLHSCGWSTTGMQGLINIRGFVLFCNTFAIPFLFVFIYLFFVKSPNYNDHFYKFFFHLLHLTPCKIWQCYAAWKPVNWWSWLTYVGRGMWIKARDCVSSESNVTVPDHLLYIQAKHTHTYTHWIHMITYDWLL